MVFAGRIKKVLNLMGSKDIDSLLITDPNDIFYYTGYFTEEAFLIIMDKSKPVLLVSPLCNDAEKEAEAEVRYLTRDRDILQPLKGITGYDEGHLVASGYHFLEKARQVRPARSIIKAPRMIKSSREVELIKKAIRISKNTLSNLTIYGRTEVWVANNLEMGFLMRGAGKSFDAIVNSGRNTNYIHRAPGKRMIKKGDMVVIDSGCKYRHYCTDLTRMLYDGGDKAAKDMVENIKNIQNEIRDFIRPGIMFSDVHKFYLKAMEKRKYRAVHSFGHGIGMDVHERPSKDDVLAKNMIITIEPGVYMKNKGCRIEDMYIVTGNSVKKLS